MPEYSKNRVLVRLRSQSEKDRNVDDDDNDQKESQISNNLMNQSLMTTPTKSQIQQDIPHIETGSNHTINSLPDLQTPSPFRLPPLAHTPGAKSKIHAKLENPIPISHRKKGPDEHIQI